jgi:hypothetical protein
LPTQFIDWLEQKDKLVTIKPAQFINKFRMISQVGFSGIGFWMDEIWDI